MYVFYSVCLNYCQQVFQKDQDICVKAKRKVKPSCRVVKWGKIFEARNGILVLLHIHSIISDSLLRLSKPQFPTLKNGHNK